MPSTASVQPNRSNRLMRTHPDGGVLYLQDGKTGGKRLRFEKENTDCLPNAANFWRRAHLQVACTCDLRGAWGEAAARTCGMNPAKFAFLWSKLPPRTRVRILSVDDTAKRVAGRIHGRPATAVARMHASRADAAPLQLDVLPLAHRREVARRGGDASAAAEARSARSGDARDARAA